MAYLWLLAPLSLFCALAALVASGATTTFDRELMAAFETWHADGLTVVMQTISHIGGTIGIATITLVAATWLALRNQRRAALRLVATVLLALGLMLLLKLLFDRARPDVFAWLDDPAGESFPSGHSLFGLLFFPLLAQTAREVHGTSGWLVAIAAVFGMSIGLSRCYLGVHWPTDVLAGFALGAFVLALAWRFPARGNQMAGVKRVVNEAKGPTRAARSNEAAY